MSINRRICIITTNKGAYSETFIRNHIDELPFEKSVLYGGMSIISDWENESPLVNAHLIKLGHRLAATQTTSLQIRVLSRFLKKKRVQAVLAEFGPVGEHVLDACLLTGVPLIVHFHGDDAHAKKYHSRYSNYERLVDHAVAVIGVSETMIEQLAALGFSKQKLHLVPYGIDTFFFSQGTPQVAKPNFVAVGRFVDKKAPHLLILAFSKVLKVIPEATLILIGIGPLLLSCKTLAEALQISTQIKFKGVCSQDEVRQYMQQSRAFLMHSVTPETGDKEGTPLSILEASATGLPVVSTRHAGISEAVVHDKTGFLVEEGDIEGMASYITALAKDASLAQRMGDAGRKHIEKYYQLKEQISKLAEVIEDVIV